MKKNLFVIPETDVLKINLEAGILQGSNFSSKGTELMSVDSEEDF